MSEHAEASPTLSAEAQRTAGSSGATDVVSSEEHALAGMAGVSALSFLVARAVPGGFWVALGGGVPLARAGQRGAREGYATAGASLVETTAVMGPARLGIAVPHAASAPLLGVLDRRGAGYFALAAAGALVRYVYYLATFAFYIWVVVGLEAYTGTYERARDLVPLLPAGQAAAIWVTAVAMVFWSAGAGLIQAWVIRRGLRRWPQDPEIDVVEPERRSAQRLATPCAPPPARSHPRSDRGGPRGFGRCRRLRRLGTATGRPPARHPQAPRPHPRRRPPMDRQRSLPPLAGPVRYPEP